MDLNYIYFFYPNACNICKKFGNGLSLKRCGNCQMIAYCSKEHQKMHWSQHKHLCNAICEILKSKDVSNFLNNKENLDAEGWAKMKMNFMLMVAIMMNRKLIHHEEEMFKFLRSCVVCHERNAKVLEDCPNCPNVSFCKKHREEGMKHKFCDLTKLCYDLDMITIKYKLNIPEIKIPHQNNYIALPKNIQDFIKYYIYTKTDLQISIKEDVIINSDYLTRPLTFLYAIQKLGDILKLKDITVHVIAANAIDTVAINLWEILIHWLPFIKMLNISLIGPEVSTNSMQINLCNNCKNENKRLSVQLSNMLYEDYVCDDAYTKPNYIIGYNAGIHEYEDHESENDTWTQSVQMIVEQDCPLILTCYTFSEVEKELLKINKILNNGIRYAYFEQNPYSSMRPHRDFETGGIYYQNQYLIIYKNLKSHD